MTRTHILLLSLVRKTIFTSPNTSPNIMAMRYSGCMAPFKEALRSAKQVVIISGEGISAESGLPVYGSGGHWRKYQASSLATPGAFLTFPSLVWEFYHYRREAAAKAEPSAGHKAIAEFEAKHGNEKSVTVITQTIDGLHARAGTKNLIELHGSLYRTKCIRCKDIMPNNDNPICEALAGRGSPDISDVSSDIPEKALPHCIKSGCGGLLRPNIVWFGENVDPSVIEKAEEAISHCDLCIVVGTSTLMFPAALYAPEAVSNGAIAAEFSNEQSTSSDFHYYFEGPCSVTLPEALAI